MLRKIYDWVRGCFGPENRTRSRVAVGHEAFIEIGDVVTPVILHDLSMNGALCRGADSFRIGQRCTLILPLSPGLRIAIEGEVVRNQEEGPAIRFTTMGPESFTHLKRMVELNAPDADVIEDELRGR
ncbi:PilZ domain-containing protein [Salidesulfovibrio onnuriiensis]|uniref:PilZ domain-containing protein n=1 Tax=Salidesulfovibrio onnuriiensis TaxID=2583823 RepID=UPI0011C6F469|nr:PilZ domain-containing protein [Salidesulfovibrio onnuriiensis]